MPHFKSLFIFRKTLQFGLQRPIFKVINAIVIICIDISNVIEAKK